MPLIRCSPDEPDPTHHLRLVGGGYDIGLILVNPGGKPDDKAISRNRLLQTSLKISQGNPKYSDFQPPWTPMVQEDWEGGRGQEQYEDDVTRILDSYNCQTGFQNKAFLGPLVRTTTGYRKMNLNQPGSMAWLALLASGSDKYISIPFTHDTNPLGSLTIPVKRKGTPNAALQVDVAEDDGSGDPSSVVLTTLELAVADVADIIGQQRRLSCLLDAATNEVENPKFEANISDFWNQYQAGAGAAWAQDTTVKFTGSASAKITAGDDATLLYADNIVLSDGETIYAQARAKTDGTPADMALNLYDKSNLTTRGLDTMDGSEEWELLTVSWTNSTGSPVNVQIRLRNRAADSASNLWGDAVGAWVDPPEAAHPVWFDGDSGDGYAWSGTADNSTSTRAANSGLPLIDGNDYHFVLYAGSASDDDENHWKIGVDETPTAVTARRSPDKSTWEAAVVEPYFLILDTDDPWDAFFFQYKRQQYFYTHPDDESAPTIWMNGYRGTADSNAGALSMLIDATQSWATDELVGKAVYITAGPGSAEKIPWRTITGNNGTSVTVDRDWLIEHTTATEYVILGCETWQEITGHGLGTNQVSDLLIVDGIMYFAHDEDANIRRGKAETSVGAWTESWADDGTNKASKLALVHHNDTAIGKRQIWRILNSTKGLNRADVEAWGTNLAFTNIAADVPVGDLEDKCTALLQYVDPALGGKICWVISKGSVWGIKSDIPDQIQLPEMATVYGDYNGAMALVHNLFLYWSMFKGGIERFYNDVVDDVGPNRDRGFPAERQGYVVDAAGYPGRIFYAQDAGDDGYSCVVMYNGDGYHEIYRSTVLGNRIRNVAIQVVPGDSPDRLWFCEGQEIKWASLPSNTIDPTKDANMTYTWEGTIVGSRMYAGMQDITKLFDSVKVMADQLIDGETWIEVDWKVDDEDNEWTSLPDTFTVSPSQEMNLVEEDEDAVTGKFGMFRIRFGTSNHQSTPILRAFLVNALSRIPNKFGWEPSVKFESASRDLKGEPDDYFEDGLAKVDDLDALADSLTVLRMSSVNKLFHGKRVVIDAAQLKPYYNSHTEEIEGYLGVMPITQVYRGEVADE